MPGNTPYELLRLTFLTTLWSVNFHIIDEETEA